MTRRDEARELCERLHRAYCKPGETKPGVVFLTEVQAPHSHRRADALALHLTAARPYIDGIEIKVSKQDWRTELADHTKADAWYQYTHRWWIAAPGGIVDPAELPAGWGLMTPNPKSDRLMTTVVKPALREPELTYPAMQEVLKKFDTARAEMVSEQVQQARTELRAEFDRETTRLREHATLDGRTRRERDIGRAVLDNTGLSLRALKHGLDDPNIAARIRAALQPGIDTDRDHALRDRLQYDAQRYHDVAAAMTAAASALDTGDNTAA